ncbi:olfactory receptor 14A16-like [Tachyglossus aculeatus]|uniref:olfactory receptor 14A16-like n=1 Tax=Tachyglossus aculeatus TaxID=9261 RepID=UPI0018F6065A|nr:olfactory receptor 14A16-like [Tachyglossus aculeatus]
MPNISTLREFLLLGFPEIQELQLVHAALFLLVYLVALSGNLPLVSVTIVDWRLHTPISTSLLGYVAQVFLVVLFAFSGAVIPMMMSYDRYSAIFHPLRYVLIMTNMACEKMTADSWLSGLLFGVFYSLKALTFSLSFCGYNIVQKFFCDAVLKRLASESRAKAFSTCLPHLAIIVFLSTGAVDYFKPVSEPTSTLGLLLSIFYTVNLSVLDLFLISVTVPKSGTISLTNNSSISFRGCVAQLLLVILFAA